MDWRQILREAAAGLASHRLRASLAVLGITIGVGAIIAMLALGEGAKANMATEFDKLGANLVMVYRQVPEQDELDKGDGRLRPLTLEDGRRVVESSTHLSDWTAEIREMDIAASQGGKTTDAQLHGILPSFQRLRNFLVGSGRLIEPADLEEAAQICVLGVAVSDALFGPGANPVGREVVLGVPEPGAEASKGKEAPGLRFRVAGVLAPKGEAMWIDYDRYILIPLTTAQRRYRGDEGVDMLQFQVKPGHDADRAAFETDMLLNRRHRGTPDYRVRLQAEFQDAVARMILIFQLFVGGIAGISLLVGGIGIMNIMLISVLERTREIGTRMAVGAKRRHILGQFLGEAMAIGLLGGMGGLALGPLLGSGIARLLTAARWQMDTWQALVSPTAAIGAMIFALLVSVSSGVYPALKASRMNPVEALRHE